MKFRITATSDENNYPTICGIHEFTSFDKALDFVRYGVKPFNSNVKEFVIRFPDDFDKKYYPACDVMIEIYDTYRE